MHYAHSYMDIYMILFGSGWQPQTKKSLIFNSLIYIKFRCVLHHLLKSAVILYHLADCFEPEIITTLYYYCIIISYVSSSFIFK